MKKIQLLLIILTVAALMACNHDKDLPGPDSDSGTSTTGTTEAFATFTITVPTAMRAKATKATDPGTSAETTVKTLHVFIYDVASPHTPNMAAFSTADNTLQPTANGWKTSTPVRTLQADKYIFVGVNLTQAIINEITSQGLGAFNYKEFAQSVADLTSTTNGFVMFNDTYPAVTSGNSLATSPEEAATHPIAISVSRVVAKAATSKAQNFVVYGGGTIQNLVYGWRNINKSFYFIQQIENGIVKDYNWDTYSTSDFIRGNDTVPVNEYSITPTKFTYALENTFNYTPQVTPVDASTFLSIRGQFRPDKIIRIKNGVTNVQDSTAFETVNNPNQYGTFYVVRQDNAISNYFINASDAQQYADLCLAGATGMPVLSGSYTLQDNTYTNGQCYFHVLVNSKATGQYTPYGIYRNQYYRLTLNSIQAPGNPNDNFDKGEVIQPNTWVNVDITIDDWEIVDEDRDI